MKIRLIEERTGGRYDNRPWPGVGQPFEVPDEEGRALILHGHAEEIPEEHVPEHPADPPPSTRPKNSPASSARVKPGGAAP